MNISLKQAADILAVSGDQVMYYKQANKINATVDQESMAWQFDLNDVLQLKANIDKTEAEAKESNDS
jgi:hypothetical protein